MYFVVLNDQHLRYSNKIPNRFLCAFRFIHLFCCLGYSKLFCWECWHCVWLSESQWQSCSSDTKLVDSWQCWIVADPVTLVKRKVRHWHRHPDLSSREKSQNTFSPGAMEIDSEFRRLFTLWTDTFSCRLGKGSQTVLENRFRPSQVSRVLLSSQHSSWYYFG